jgi:hypothetical protein
LGHELVAAVKRVVDGAKVEMGIEGLQQSTPASGCGTYVKNSDNRFFQAACREAQLDSLNNSRS